VISLLSVGNNKLALGLLKKEIIIWNTTFSWILYHSCFRLTTLLRNWRETLDVLSQKQSQYSRN
jgi:hypothetical protein